MDAKFIDILEEVAKERERLGRLVRELWVSWAEKQPNPKPSWLVPFDDLSEQDKEADRVIGYGLFLEFNAEVTGERLEHERLKQHFSLVQSLAEAMSKSGCADRCKAGNQFLDAMRGEFSTSIPEHLRLDMEKTLRMAKRLEAAEALLKRAYDGMHKEHWQEGESEQECCDAIDDVFFQRRWK
jgi:hypothetical protein